MSFLCSGPGTSKPFNLSAAGNCFTKSSDNFSHSISSWSFRLVGRGVGGNSSLSVCEDASLVVAFTLKITSVLCIICRPSITLGCSDSLGLCGGEIVCVNNITLGEDGGEDSGVVRNGVFADVEVGDWVLIGVVLLDRLGDKVSLISGDCCNCEGLNEKVDLIGGGDFGNGGGDCSSGDCNGDFFAENEVGEVLGDGELDF